MGFLLRIKENQTEGKDMDVCILNCYLFVQFGRF